MHDELQIHVEAVFLVIAAFFRQEQRPLRAAAVGIDQRYFLGESGGSQQSDRDRRDHPGCGSHELTPIACGTSSLKSFLALSSKISFLSAALSQSNASIRKRVSSSQRPVRGSFTVPTPGRSVPNRHRSAPTVLISSCNDSL